MDAHAHGASALAEDGDAAGVAPERRNVALHPLQGKALVLDAPVALQRPRGEVAQRVQPVVDGHHHHAQPLQFLAVVHPERTPIRALHEGTAVEEHHDLGRDQGAWRVSRRRGRGAVASPPRTGTASDAFPSGAKTFKFRQSSLCCLGTSGLWCVCTQPGPNWVASRAPVHGAGGFGAAKRFSPPVDAA